MSDAFEIRTIVQQSSFNRYAEKVVGGTVRPLDWQGYHSYTVESEDERTVIQFRSDQSPLDDRIITLAKRIHPNLVPAIERLEFLDDPTVSVWKMDKISGVGFLDMTHDDNIETKLRLTITDMAEFYIQAWKALQIPDRARILSIRQECEMKLKELAQTTSPSFLTHVRHASQALDEIFQLPWVLSHEDLSSMNLLLDRTTGHLRGVIDWADAAVWPFGIALWGLESVLGYGGPDGWIWLDDESRSCRTVFSRSLQTALHLPAGDFLTIEKARKLGLLLRYGFVWQEGRHVLTDNTAMLELFLGKTIFM